MYTLISPPGISPFSVTEPAAASSGGDGDGWNDFDEPSWGTMEETPSKRESSGSSKQEQLQRKREERRLKQQAAREKKAAGVGLKPSGLGAVKKN